MDVDTTLPGYDAERSNGRPPWVKFHWGTSLHSFKAVVKSIDVGFTYFSSEGLPLRANVEMSLEQYEPDANWGPQNPTSGTPKPNRTHQVQVGDTLDRISARYYGDPTQWRGIADANGIGDPLDLRPGRLLAIPERGRLTCRGNDVLVAAADDRGQRRRAPRRRLRRHRRPPGRPARSRSRASSRCASATPTSRSSTAPRSPSAPRSRSSSRPPRDG